MVSYVCYRLDSAVHAAQGVRDEQAAGGRQPRAGARQDQRDLR